MSQSITITLPLPPKGLNLNASHHRMKRARLTAKYRYDCGFAVKDAMNRAKPADCPWNKVTRKARFFFASKRAYDPNNLNAWIKAADDAMQDAGLIVNDRELAPLPPEAFYGQDDPRLELIVQAEVHEQIT